MKPPSRLLATLLLLISLVALLPNAAHAADAVQVREVSVSEDGTVRLVVTAAGMSGSLSRNDVTVTENGATIGALTVAPLDTAQVRATVALVIDVSGSTAGTPIANAKKAAQRFVSLLPPGVDVALFAFGPTVRAVLRPTGDRARVRRAIGTLKPNGGTALYDAIRVAARSLQRVPGQHDIVVFSDGKDTASRTTLAQAVASARTVKASVTSVGLVTTDYDARALAKLASSTGGSVFSVGRARDLAAAFGRVANEIASRWVITFAARSTEARQLEYVVAVAGLGSDNAATLSPIHGRAALGSGTPHKIPPPPIAALASSRGFAVGVTAAALGLFLLATILIGRGKSPGDRALKRLRKERHEESHDLEPGEKTSVVRQLLTLFERLPISGAGNAKLQLSLDRAGWPIRTSEFRAMQVVGGSIGVLIGGLVLGSILSAVIIGVIGSFIPQLILIRRTDRRKTLFLQQLPDTLQLLAGSLQAGYAFMQAIDTLVREAAQPTSDEFKRVLTEARLGMPLDEALQQMGERVDSEDFNWVVLAINIQRQVGGNLATLLHTVSDTLRSRDQVRRQIKVLSAEGRLSGVILVGLPFLLTGYMMLVNPDYLRPLFEETVGRVMLAVVVGLMGAGVMWMRKLVRIDV